MCRPKPPPCSCEHDPGQKVKTMWMIFLVLEPEYRRHHISECHALHYIQRVHLHAVSSAEIFLKVSSSFHNEPAEQQRALTTTDKRVPKDPPRQRHRLEITSALEPSVPALWLSVFSQHLQQRIYSCANGQSFSKTWRKSKRTHPIKMNFHPAGAS